MCFEGNYFSLGNKFVPNTSTISERTTEVNLLSDISLLIKQQFKTNVTVISPSTHRY